MRISRYDMPEIQFDSLAAWQEDLAAKRCKSCLFFEAKSFCPVINLPINPNGNFGCTRHEPAPIIPSPYKP